MNDFLISFLIVVVFFVVGLSFFLIADRGRGYNFLDMDDGKDDKDD